MKAEIKCLDYTTKKGSSGTIINLIARNNEGQRICIQNDEHESHFFIPREQYDASLTRNEKVTNIEHGFMSIRGREMTKVCTRIPGDVPKLREDYEHYEADVLYPNRFSLDTGIYGGVEIPDKYFDKDRPEVPLSEIEKIEHDTETRIMFCDIEVNDDGGFPDETTGRKEVVCLSFYDTFEKEYNVYLYRDDDPDVNPQPDLVDDVNVEVFDDEVDMLSRFADRLNEMLPDVIAGWNFKKFDAMYLISRFDILDGLSKSDLSPLGSAYNDGWYGGKVRGFEIFDMLKAYKNLQFTELDSYSLEDVAQEELGIGKLEEGEDRIHKLWENNLNALLEYNIRDVYLTVKLEEEQGIIKFYEEVANFVGGRVSEVVDYSKAADIYVLRQVNGKFIVPSSDTIAQDSEEFEGAEVFDPATEIKDMVSVLDLKSLYPMSMKTINAGPRTKDPNGEITAPNGVSFTKEQESIISELIDNLLEEREDKKEQRDKFDPDTDDYIKYDLQQTAVKVIMNTLYGVLGWDRFRLYDEDVAASVTATGREVIKYTQNIVQELGYSVIYGDTDSVMVEMAQCNNILEVIERGFEMEDIINESYDEFAKEELNVDEHFFEIEFEKIYRRFIQAGKKKRYAGHIVWKEGKETDTIDIVGFEYQRSDYSIVAKDIQQTLIEMILMGADRDEVGELVRDEIEKITNLEHPLDDLGIPGGIGQAFHKYESKTKHVRAAEYANEHFGEQIQPGDKPKGIYTDKIVWDKPQPPKMKDSRFICWMNSNNVPDKTQYDWEKYLEVQINGPLSRIIECTEWTWSEIVSGEVQTGYDEFEDDDSGDDVFESGIDITADKDISKKQLTEDNDNKKQDDDGMQVNTLDMADVGSNNGDDVFESSLNSTERVETGGGQASIDETIELQDGKNQDNGDDETEHNPDEELEFVSFDEAKEEGLNKEDKDDEPDIADFA